MKKKIWLTGSLLVAVLALCGMILSDKITFDTPFVLPVADFHFDGTVGRTYLESDPAKFPQPVKAPKGAPNVVVILLDDAGFGQFSTYGGGVPSPTMDKLAATGLRYNKFHTTALCSPTRAALITGRNHHSAAFASITEAATGYEGYTCILPKSCGTVAQVLGQNGYNTAWIGKNHNTPTWETSSVGPFDHWANGLGFDYFYGFNSGDMNHWNPVLYENRNLVPASKDPDYHMTVDLADHAINWVRQSKSIAPDKPYFLYVAPGATHAPHHAPADWIAKFKGKFDMGWDAYREQAFERQKKLGVIPATAKLTPRPESLPAWESLNDDQKRLYAHMMEVFAAYGAHCDYQMGRVVDAVKQMPDADNTIIMYIAGDNGSSAEGGLEGSVNEMLFFNGGKETWQDNIKVIDELGGPKHFNHFPSAWAWAMNTPFQWTKQVASHFGGTRNPLIVEWPKGITDKGGVRNQFTHVIDIVPTIYELCKINAPTSINGIPQKPIEGTSFAYTLNDANAKERHTVQYFELGVNRGIYQNGWMASALSFPPWQAERNAFDPDKQNWELYNVNEDFTQAADLAKQQPDKLRQMQDLWWVEAAKYNVLPLDWRGPNPRMNGELMGRPSLTLGKKSFTYYEGMIGIPDAVAPPVLNKSWSITADIIVNDSKTNGIIITHGGVQGGYALYFQNGKPTFQYNYFGVDRLKLSSSTALAKGKHKIVVNFTYDGGGLGKGGKFVVSSDGKTIAEGRVEKTVPVQISIVEGMDVGMDTGSPLDNYTLPFKFTGTIEKVTVDLK